MLELGDVLRAELPALAEMRDQRRDAAIEHPIQKAFALFGHPGVALQHRRIQIAAPVAAGTDRALGQQPIEQRLDGGLGPVPAGQRGHHLIGAQRMIAPQHLHHDSFGFTDLAHHLHP
ncbi:hypothetical protein D9M71_815790 [compost metagenome]